MKRQLGLVGLALMALALIPAVSGVANAGTYRWDFVSLVPPDVNAGGIDSAMTVNGELITLTGSGTFVTENPTAVTGGGTYVRHDKNGHLTGSGTYKVTGLVIFRVSPGSLVGTGLVDHIGTLADTRAGVAVLSVKYSNGAGGILIVNCAIPGAPVTQFEGISATKGFVNFAKTVPPAPGVNANRTLFHVIH